MLLALLVILDAGRDLTRQFYAGETPALWARMTPQMQAALGSLANLDALRAQVAAQAGTELAVLDEKSQEEGGLHIYRRLARYSKADVEIRWVLDKEDRIAGFFIRPAALSAAPAKHDAAMTRLALPFRGAWTVVWGGRTLEQNYHASTRDQRFAFDLLIVREGRTHAGDKLEHYFAFGQPVLAPAAGTVTEAIDGLSDQAPGVRDPSHAMGNHVVIDHGNGEFSFLCHLQGGSVKVKAGDKVRTGDLLGSCGNSGNTTEPHLHYHLQDTPRPFDGDGLPAEFVDYLADGKRVERGMPIKGQVISR